jgi:hypothetical protein
MPFSCQNYFTSFRPISIINHPSIVSKNLSANFQTKKHNMNVILNQAFHQVTFLGETMMMRLPFIFQNEKKNI